MTHKGLPITIHSIAQEFGRVVAVVNKGEARSPATFKVDADKIEGFILA